MPLNSLSYTEFEGDPRFWKLEQCDLAPINLVVGRNATGKTRVINVIDGLCRLLSGRSATIFQSGKYEAEITLSGKAYSLNMEFAHGHVIKESLKVDGTERLTRDHTGKGEIFYEAEGKSIEFQLPPTVIALQQRRDELQHSFVIELSKWALGAQTYLFGSSLGKDVLVGLGNLQTSVSQREGPREANDLVRAYTKAFEKHSKPFDMAVIADMQYLGYELTDVGATDIRQFPGAANLPFPEPIIGMFVTESDRGVPLSQMEMSQGMFRALALIIHINIAAFDKQRTLVLVDDIGEGLDYERSAGLIDVLIRHAKESDLQVIMTSNDRFVMNRVPLEHWVLLRRDRAIVRAYTARNSQKQFEDFKYMGLSNFDFFASAKLD